ncbi:MAG TPA: sterol desaturase family protein [Rhodocyclaceae bacterium]|nr:sterol desaturase family protein [Rhodocyclaceae bacterium]
MSDLSQLWSHMIAWLSGHVVTPVLFILHIQGTAGDPSEIAEAGMIAVMQICIIGLILRPLESLWPAERWTDRHLTGIDRLYTLLMLLGLFPLFSFLVLTPLGNLFLGASSDGAVDSAISVKHLMPWFEHHPLWLFFVYYVIYDLTYYWMHRAQHAIPWWWALHSMHHSQRQMSCWTNDRGSYLDGALQSVILAVVGIAMGVDPSQFALLMLMGELVQNFSHTNVRIGFGWLIERVFVDPKFHRLHHMRVDPARPNLHNCNFGQVLSIWDTLFGTALFGEAPRPTGVGDPTIDADNERGLIAMQWWTLKRFWGAFRRRSGWRFSDVAFGDDYEPIPSRHADVSTFEQVPRLVDGVLVRQSLGSDI